MGLLWVECGARTHDMHHLKSVFRNLLYFSRLTNQFTIIFAPIWDNFGTLFEILGKGFYSAYLSEFQYVTNMAGITRGKLLGKGIS